MKRSVLPALAAVAAATFGSSALASSDPFVGEMAMFPYGFCPRGWAAAEGQLLPISQNQTLYSLYGTTYGGDGRTTFALPDLRGRTPMHGGAGPGLPAKRLGEKLGQETTTLTTQTMPAHNHALMASSQVVTQGDPTNSQLGVFTTRNPVYASGATLNKVMEAGAIGATGGSMPASNIAPTAVVQYCVSLFGIFPSRN